MTGPAYRIATPRLVLRCWDPADSPLLSAAIVQSLEHLRPWMPWAHEEPKAPGDRVKLLRRFRANFDSDIDFVYGIFDAGERGVIGGTGVHTHRRGREGDRILDTGRPSRARIRDRGNGRPRSGCVRSRRRSARRSAMRPKGTPPPGSRWFALEAAYPRHLVISLEIRYAAIRRLPPSGGRVAYVSTARPLIKPN